MSTEEYVHSMEAELDRLRALGCPVGMGSHVPATRQPHDQHADILNIPAEPPPGSVIETPDGGLWIHDERIAGYPWRRLKQTEGHVLPSHWSALMVMGGKIRVLHRAPAISTEGEETP